MRGMTGRVQTTREQRIARYERLVQLRDEGKSEEEAGAALNPPLTKQRVSMILKAGPPRAIGRPKREVVTKEVSQVGPTVGV